MLVLSSLIFLAVALGAAAFVLWLTPTRAEQRLQVMASPTEKSDWTETIVKVAGPLAKLSTPEGDWENSPLRLRFLHAGIRNPDARLVYFAAKTLLPLVLAGLTFTALRGMTQGGGLEPAFLHSHRGADRLLPAEPGDLAVDPVPPA